MNQRPRLSLDTAVPDRLPVAINVAGERRIYMLRDTAEYSTRERKRLSGLLKGIVEFEQAEEDDVTDDDVKIYERAMREVMIIAMPDVPLAVVEQLSLREHGRLCAYVLQLFSQGATTPTPPMNQEQPTPLPTGPTRLRRLADRLTLGKVSLDSADSTAEPPISG